MKNIKEYYNKTSEEWALKWYEDDSMLPCLDDFISRFSDNPRILDLCCGAGYESLRMSNLGAEVVGLDFSEESIRIARERNPHIQFYVGNMLDDYSYIGIADGVVIIAGFVHLPNDKLRLAYSHIARILKDDGMILIVVRDGSGKREQQSYVTIDGEEYDRDFYAHSLKELIKYSEGIFEFVEEVFPDEDDCWKKYIFKKV